MKFIEAFKIMKEGGKIKLPSWGGYWYWDAEKRTIMMKCRIADSDVGKDLLDIRETKRVEYTIRNILSDEWIVADEQNTPVLGGEATFSFSEAIKYMKRGLKVARRGWNGKSMFLFLADDIEFTTDADLACVSHLEGDITQRSIVMKTADDHFCVGWLASQADMLSEDWVVVE